MDASSSQEWLTTVDPISVTLAEGLSETIEVTVWVQEGTEGLVDTTVVTATSLFDSNAFASAWNETTVVGSATPPALSLTPDRGANVSCKSAARLYPHLDQPRHTNRYLHADGRVRPRLACGA